MVSVWTLAMFQAFPQGSGPIQRPGTTSLLLDDSWAKNFHKSQNRLN